MPNATVLSRIFLVVTALGLTPIALSYGLHPGKSLPWLFGIDAADVNTRHIFRAIMGLYLALACYWIAGSLKPNLRVSALQSLVIFMAGLALGRLSSLILDGWPHRILVLYMALEFLLAGIGLGLLRGVLCKR